MSLILLVPAIILFIALLWFIGTYNGLVRLRNHCRESWSGIDTELKRRHDLIPLIVTAVQEYASGEKQLFEAIAAARNAAAAGTALPNILQRSEAENNLLHGVNQAMIVAEAYPALKSDSHFLRLQQELINTEDRLQAARRFYNANVRDLNNRVESIPSRFIAGMAGIEQEAFFEIEELAIRHYPAANL